MNYGSLLVCATCGDIKGPVPDLGDPAVRVRARQAAPCRPRWERYDYNTAYELCLCCGLVALRSGSRWSFGLR